MRALTVVFLLSGVACGAAPECPPDASVPLVLPNLRVAEESETSPCELPDVEEIRRQALELAKAVAQKNARAIQPLVHEARGLTLQWSRPIPWADLSTLFESEVAVQGWCSPGGAPVAAPPRQLLATLLEQGHGKPPNGDEAVVHAEGRWRYEGGHPGVCLRGGSRWPFSNESFVELEGGLVVVFARQGAHWRASALVRLDLGNPCG